MKESTASSRWRRILMAVFFFLLLLSTLTFWLVGSNSGARASFRLLALMSGGQIQANDIRGNVISHLEIGHLEMSAKDGHVTISQLTLHWQPEALRDRLLRINDLQVGQLTLVRSGQPETQPQHPPATLGLPFQILIDRLRIDRLSIRQNNQAQVTMTGLRLHWHFDGQAHRLDLQSADLTELAGQRTAAHLRARVHLQASQPFVLQSDVSLQGRQGEWAVLGKGEIAGVLTDMSSRLDVRLSRPQSQTRLVGKIRLQPFSDQRLRAAELRVEQLDLATLQPDWPQTRIDAEMVMKSHQQGKFTLRNALPGTLDKDRLPVADASGSFRLGDNAYLAIENLCINKNIVRADLKRQHGQWQISAAVQQLNLAQIDSRLRATQLQGDVHLTQTSKQTLLKIALSELVQKKHGISAPRLQYKMHCSKLRLPDYRSVMPLPILRDK